MFSFNLNKLNKKNIYKFLKIFVLFLITLSWIFSGWLQIWKNPPIPQRIQETKASSGAQIKTVEFFIHQYATTTANGDIPDGFGINAVAYSTSSCGATGQIAVNVNLPESGITIRHAYVEWRTDTEDPDGGTAPAGEMYFCRSGGSAVFNKVETIAGDSGERMPLLLRLNVSSIIASGNNTYFFNAKFTGAIRNSDNAKLIITYEYDDASSTQLKTVRQAIGCRYTQAAAGTTDNFTLNPNLGDPSIFVRNAFVEFSSIDGTSADVQKYAIMNGANGASAQMDAVNATGRGYVILNSFASTTINLSSNNTIGLHNAGSTADAKCGELVITFTHSTGGTQNKTVRYFAGQLSGGISTADNAIGTVNVCVPETPTSSVAFRKVWLRYQTSANAAATITMRATIGSASQITQTMAFPATVWAGGETISLFDITSNFTTNFSFPCANVRVGISSGSTAASGPRAEIIIAYAYDASQTASANLKTVYWFVGQDYAANAANASFSANFNTFIPETGVKTWRSAAVLDECHHASSTAPSCSISVDSSEVAGTDSNNISFVMDNESALNNTGILASQLNPSTLASQSNISVTYNSAQQHTSGGAAYTTYQFQPQVVTVSSLGDQTLTADIPSNDKYMGGAFTFSLNAGAANVTQIIITETDTTLSAQNYLNDVKIFYKQETTCTTSSIPGDATAFNASGVGFNSAEKATTAGTMALTTSQMCVWVQLDVLTGAPDADTIEIEITNPSTEVAVSAGTVSPATAITIPGATILIGNQAPTGVSNCSLNGGVDPINLIENSTKSVTLACAITDPNGCNDIASATATIYFSLVSNGFNCAADNNTCYRVDSGCTLNGSCSGNDRYATCTAALWFHATSTNENPTDSIIWTGRMTGFDSYGLSASATNTGQNIDVNALLGLSITATINYGTISPLSTSSQQTIVATTTGNVPIDINLAGTNLVKTPDFIPVGQQRYSTTSGFSYASGAALTTGGANLELDSGKPTTNPSNATNSIFWLIVIPSGSPVGTYTGTVTSTAIPD